MRDRDTYKASREKLNTLVEPIENELKADVLWYCGSINDNMRTRLPFEVEKLTEKKLHDNLAFFLTTNGGSAEVAEQVVQIIRHHYGTVYFIIPDHAMSAGTMIALSGDRMYMKYTSVLGPIDPQVPSKGNGNWVSALGYLDKTNELIERSKQNNLTQAELSWLLDQDMGFLSHCEQASVLAQQLVQDWLYTYKFKTWLTHSTNKKEVTIKEKKKRAKEIVEKLANNKHWHSHSRMINMKTLQNELKILVENYEDSALLKTNIANYHDLLMDCMQLHGGSNWFHSRVSF